jgi:ligand-binding sensor domain-containing protein
MTKFVQRLKSNKRLATFSLVALAIIAFSIIIYFIVRFNSRIRAEREQLAAAARVEVQESQLRPPPTDGLTAYLNSSDVRATAVLNNVRYFATSGGLLAVDEGGTLKRRYTTIDGLTDNDLTALAIFQNRLFVGTGANGMMAFDGNSFTGYRFTKPKATRVSVLLATDTELLIGTLDGGLFEYDGEKFTRRLNSATGADFEKVTALLANNSRIYIGTQDKGCFLWREAQFQHFATPEGLPAPRVTAIAVLPSSDTVVIATDFGAVTLNNANEIKELSKQPNMTSIAVSKGRLYAGLFTGGLIEIKSSGSNSPTVSEGVTPDARRQTTNSRLIAGDGKLWMLTQQGAFVRDEASGSPAFEPVASTVAKDGLVTAAHIMSLAIDRQSRLWVGYFDQGVDIISTETSERIAHLEDDRVREVNFITFDKTTDSALIATSRGLVAIDGKAKQTVLTKEQGLIDNAIAHVSFVEDNLTQRGNRMMLATAGGLTELAQGRARSLTAFHGLSSNHLYTSASVGSRLFVGSLGGLVELEGLRVVQVYKKSSSKLSEDWVTALAEANGVLYVGTIGGIDALLPTGEWVNFADELGKIEVNQNAMHFDGERLYVGTSDSGLLVYNVRERRWSRISGGLSSQNVTSITSTDRFIYVGTLNGLMRIEKRVMN